MAAKRRTRHGCVIEQDGADVKFRRSRFGLRKPSVEPPSFRDGVRGWVASASPFSSTTWTRMLPKDDRGLSRQGDKHLRKLFSLGASTVMRAARRPQGGTVWQRGILARRPVKVAVLAQAAKTARIVWAVLTSGLPYRPQHHTPLRWPPHPASPGAAPGQLALAAPSLAGA